MSRNRSIGDTTVIERAIQTRQDVLKLVRRQVEDGFLGEVNRVVLGEQGEGSRGDITKYLGDDHDCLLWHKSERVAVSNQRKRPQSRFRVEP